MLPALEVEVDARGHTGGADAADLLPRRDPFAHLDGDPAQMPEQRLGAVVALDDDALAVAAVLPGEHHRPRHR